MNTTKYNRQRYNSPYEEDLQLNRETGDKKLITTFYYLTMVFLISMANIHASTAIYHTPTAFIRTPTTIFRPPMALFHVPTTIFRAPTASIHPPITIFHTPTATTYKGFEFFCEFHINSRKTGVGFRVTNTKRTIAL